MAKEIVGLRPYDFEDKATKKTVSGYTVYLQWTEDGIDGIACEKCSISTAKLDGYIPGIGDLVRVGYNKYEKAEMMVPVGSSNT